MKTEQISKDIKALQTIDDFLKKKSEYNIDVFNSVVDSELYYKKLTLKKLHSFGFSSLYDLVVDLKHKKKPSGSFKICIQKYTPNGSSRIKNGQVYYIELTSPEESLSSGRQDETENAPTNVGHPVSEVHTQHNNHQNMNVTQNNSMHPYGLNAAAAGLSLPDIINMNTKVARYDELKDNHFNLKNEFAALKKENDSLVRELGKKEAIIHTSELKHSLEIEREKSNNTPVISPTVVNTFLEKGMPVLEAILASKATAPSGLTGQEIKTDLSPNKEGLISLITYEKFTEDDAVFLGTIAAGCQKNPEFKKHIEQLIIQFNIKV
jgi:hypothetical protein